MSELQQIIVRRASELPEDVQKEHKVFGETLVEIRLVTNSPKLVPETITPIRGRFSTRLHQLLEESGCLRD